MNPTTDTSAIPNPAIGAPDIEVTRKHFLDWLRDAHAMEMQAETMMSAMAGRLEHYPDLKQRILQHIDETREQARLLETCLARYESDTSTVKDMAGKAMAMMQGLGGMLASDEVIKGGMVSYAFENFEIAAYSVLIEGARMLGDRETMAICERILAEERAMASWLEHNTAAVTRRYLVLAGEPGVTARR